MTDKAVTPRHSKQAAKAVLCGAAVTHSVKHLPKMLCNDKQSAVSLSFGAYHVAQLIIVLGASPFHPFFLLVRLIRWLH